MILLLINSKIIKINIIIIQKLYYYKNIIIIHCSQSCNFWSVYSEKKHVSICFLINKRISSHCWNVKFIAKNLTVLIFQQKNSRLNITNIYSSLLESYNHMIDSSSIHYLCNRTDLVSRYDDLMKHSSWISIST